MTHIVNNAFSDNSPNGFRRPPDWGWSVRAAVFPGQDIDGGNVELFKLTDRQIQDAVDRFADRGVNLIQCAGFHARMMWIPHWDQITELNRKISAAAHRRGIHAFDHLSCNGMWTEVKDKYRGWCPDESCCVDIRTGLRYPPDKVKFCCLNDPRFRENFFHYVTGYLHETGVDALMCDDMLFYRGQYGCGCSHCRKKFKEFVGYEMPKPGEWRLDDYKDPTWRDWIKFRMDAISDFVVELRRLLPVDVMLFNDMSQGVLGLDDAFHGGGSFEALARAASCLICESGGFSYRETSSRGYSNYQSWEHMYVNRKYMAAVSTHFQIPFIQHQYPATPDEGFFCWALNKSMSMSHWRDDCWLYGGPRYPDEFQEWTPSHDYLNWEAQNESLWKYALPCSETAILFSFRSKRNLGPDPQPHGEEFAGWAQTLQREKIFFDVLIDADLEDGSCLTRLKTLILPNAVCLSERQVENVKSFVERGGFLIATHLTSSRDEDGNGRNDFAMADLFGVSCAPREFATQRSALLTDHRFREHRICAELPPRMSFTPTLTIKWSGEADGRQALAWIERTQASFDWPVMPGMVLNRFGGGSVLYILPQVGALAFREGPYPVWGTAPEMEGHADEVTPGQCAWQVVSIEKRPDDERMVYVDESSDAFRKLIVGSVRFANDNPRLSITGLPEAILCEARSLSPHPAAIGQEDACLISLMNLTGVQFKHGDTVPHAAIPQYPQVEGKAVLRINGLHCMSAELFSPDMKTPCLLSIVPSAECALVEIPLALVRRVAFVRIGLNR